MASTEVTETTSSTASPASTTTNEKKNESKNESETVMEPETTDDMDNMDNPNHLETKENKNNSQPTNEEVAALSLDGSVAEKKKIKLIKLISKDKQTIEIVRDYLKIAEVLWTAAEGEKDATELDVPQVMFSELEAIVCYLNHHKGVPGAEIEKPIKSTVCFFLFYSYLFIYFFFYNKMRWKLHILFMFLVWFFLFFNNTDYGRGLQRLV
jgi:hypothetical protein